MKTRKIRLLSALLALAMLLALLPTAAFADNIVAHGTCGAEGNEKNVTWTLDSNGTLTISGTGAMEDYGRQSNQSAPWRGKNIINVVIGDGVTTIGKYAFQDCTNLKNVTFPSSIETIEKWAFYGCVALESVDLSHLNDLEQIKNNAFNNCAALKTVKLPQNGKLNTIGVDAFSFTNSQPAPQITEITIPASVTTIGDGAFEGCSKLKKVTFAPDSKLQTIGTDAFGRCHKDLIICYSDERGKQALTKAGVKADKIKPAKPTVNFDSNKGTTVDSQTVANGEKVTEPTIKPTRDGWNFAGWYTKDESGKWAAEPFDFDTPITNDMTLYARWTASGTCGVGGNDLTWTLDDSGTLTISGSGAMKDYSGVSGRPWNNRSADIRTVVIENDVTRIGDRAFAGCESLATVNLPENGKLEKIGFNAFGNYNSDRSAPIITKIAIPASVKVIDAYAFKGCEKLGTVTFAPDSKLELINGWAFQGTALTQITIPASITTFDGEAFKDCKKLEEVTFEAPSGLCEENDNISDNAFTGCTKLSKINCEAALQEKLASKLPADVKPAFNITDATDSGSDTNPETYSITIDYGTAYDADHNAITKAAAGETVYLEANETAFDGMTFERWEVRKGEVKLENDRAAETTFTMPAGEVQLEAMYQAADASDSGWDAATVVTGAVIGTGTAILAYHIGMEVYAEQVLGKGMAVPRTRSEVALLAWQLAGSPAVNGEGEPLSEAAQAQRWAVESGLMQNDAEGNFNGTKKMSKWNALRTLEKAKQ